jgi:hypothetical protein
MSEPAHRADMLACGGRHSGWEPACAVNSISLP